MACAKLMISMLLCVATVYAVNLGGTCVDNAACDTNNAHCMHQYEGCTEGLCTCSDGFYAAANDCRDILMINEACTNDVAGNTDCAVGTMGSTCENGVCECPANRPNVETVNNIRYCYGVLFGDPCEDHVECLTRSSSGTLGVCHDTEGTCGCADHARQDGQACRLGRHGEECSDNGLECEDGFTCTDNACACPVSEKWHEGRCVDDAAVPAGVGDVCDDDDLEAEARVCDAGVMCDRCPEDANTVDTTCKEPAGGASGVTATITSVLGAATLVTLKMIL